MHRPDHDRLDYAFHSRKSRLFTFSIWKNGCFSLRHPRTLTLLRRGGEWTEWGLIDSGEGLRGGDHRYGSRSCFPWWVVAKGFAHAQAVLSLFLPMPCPHSRNSNIGRHLPVLVLFNLPFVRWKHHLRIFSLLQFWPSFFCSLLICQELQVKVALAVVSCLGSDIGCYVICSLLPSWFAHDFHFW